MALNPGTPYRGELAQANLAEILHRISLFRVPGVAEASRAGTVKRLYLKDGHVVHASSSDRSDWLGFFLRRTGRLTPQGFSASMLERDRGGRRLGAVLIELGLLSPAEVYQAIRDQVQAIAWSLFSWEDGMVTFRPGEAREEEQVQIRLPLRRVIVEGVKRSPDAKRLAPRLGNRDTVLEPAFRAEDLIDIGLDGSDYRLLSMVDGKKTLYELCAGGPHSPAENLKLLYAYHVLELVRPARAEARGGGPIKIRFKTAGDEFDTSAV